MKNRSLTTAIAMATILGFGISLVGHAASHTMPGKPAGGAMMKDGGDKDGKGGKDKMKGSTMMKDGGKGGKDKMKSGTMMKDGSKGGKDKMGGTMMKDGGDKGGKGGKDKMKGSTMMKDGGEKGGKGGKDKMMDGAGGMR